MKEPVFKLKLPFKPDGDQIKAIKELSASRVNNKLNKISNSDEKNISTLLGVTGSGKTFTIANVIANQSKKVLVLAPNKTLAAQLYEEFSLFFPENKVCYFVSYYDYYQPESYLPAQDIYIAKETKINAELERLRIESAASIINRDDTIVIASVSCIYSLGNPQDYQELALPLQVGQKIKRNDLLHKLNFIQYQRNEVEKKSGTYQVFGNTIEIQLPYQKEKLKIDIFDDAIESLEWIDKQNNSVFMELDNALIFPAKYFVITQDQKEKALNSIEKELNSFLPKIKNDIYNHRLKTRINHDLEMIRETGYCSGIENYSIHFDGRSTGQKPYCLLDFFKDDFLLIIDESHIAIPQLHGMYKGDRHRKQNLIDFGFRLPSALDNRPLKFEEIEKYFKDVIFVSATPSQYEYDNSNLIVEQIIRPTGLVDPEIIIHPRQGQIDHLIKKIKENKDKDFRSLVTVLTKKLAEELSYYLEKEKIKVCYLHSDIKTPERTAILNKLRLGVFDCIVGVNLLREGLDLPEVALVAILDADVESFLRDKRSIIQIVGRAARNTQAKVILYADKITKSMKEAISETERRRALQIAYNKEHNITPTTVTRDVSKSISKIQEAIALASKSKTSTKSKSKINKEFNPTEILDNIAKIEILMQQAAENFDFEKAIKLREQWFELKKLIDTSNKK
ncbi:MAG: excinuclease ABC subunit UvrB [Novosphingobium sp.]|nr:excinuclease ABC subunit UvrB [Novosphingobium sp.]